MLLQEGFEERDAGVQLNLALLLGEMNRLDEAQPAFLNVLRCDPSNAVAAYNLGVIAARTNAAAAAEWTGRAAAWRPDDPRYVCAQVHYLAAAGRAHEAAEVCRQALARPNLSAAARTELETRLRALTTPPPGRNRGLTLGAE